MARVVLENVSKSFQGPKKELIQAVKAVSFAAEDQELLVLVGPSGSGKSTLLRLIAGLEEISGGTIAIDGVVVNKLEPKDRDIAMVFQNFALYPHMTVHENLGFPLKLRKVPNAETDRRVRETAEMLGLLPSLNRLPSALSGGERQRVALGRAVVRRPKVFLFDEPLSNLDAQMRMQMRTEIAALQKQLRTTMIYVTHDQVEAMTLGTRVAVLRDGAIQQVDQPTGLYHAPVNLFVAGFIGSPTMNLLLGRVVEKDGRSWFQTKNSGSGNLDLELPDELRSRGFIASVGEIILGLRPEHISLAQTTTSGASDSSQIVVRARIQLLEALGSDTYCHAIVGTHKLVARIPGDIRMVAGQDVALALDLSKAHLFDPKTERRL